MTGPAADELDIACEVYGRDPAELIGVRDPVLAWQLRNALLARRARRLAAAPKDEGVDELLARARAEGGWR